jgi:hypothetical protein
MHHFNGCRGTAGFPVFRRCTTSTAAEVPPDSLCSADAPLQRLQRYLCGQRCLRRAVASPRPRRRTTARKGAVSLGSLQGRCRERRDDGGLQLGRSRGGGRLAQAGEEEWRRGPCSGGEGSEAARARPEPSLFPLPVLAGEVPGANGRSGGARCVVAEEQKGHRARQDHCASRVDAMEFESSRAAMAVPPRTMRKGATARRSYGGRRTRERWRPRRTLCGGWPGAASGTR